MALRRTLAILAVALLLPACRFSGALITDIVVHAELRGSQVLPAVATPSTGTAVVTVPGNRMSIAFSVTYAGAGVVSGVEIRLGGAGTDGPLLFTLATGPFTNPLSVTIDQASFTPLPAEGISVFGEAINRILDGTTYVLIRTAADPSGEMRGQLGAATLASAVLSGAQEVPPVAGPGAGSFMARFDTTQSTITTTLNVSGLGSATTAAHLHFGAAGVGGGPVLFDLSTVAFTSPLVVTLTAADFQTDPSVVTFADAVDALLTGGSTGTSPRPATRRARSAARSAPPA
jgi:hypothetical protein